MVGKSGTSNTGKLYRYYCCRGKFKDKNCKKKNEKKEYIEWYVVKETQRYILSDDRIRKIASSIIQSLEKESDDNKVKELEKQLKHVDREISKCANKILNTDNELLINKINERADQLQAENDDLLAELEIFI